MSANSYSSTHEVGRFYRVPCVRGKYYGKVADWPVIGPQHEDTEFVGFRWQHYHIDWRFIPVHLFEPVGYRLGAPLMTSDAINPDGLPKPVLRRRKMQRAMMDFAQARAARWFPKLEAAYATCKLKPGMICPHRGIPLAGVHMEGDIATCPGHGLRWNVKTGELCVSATSSGTQKEKA